MKDLRRRWAKAMLEYLGQPTEENLQQVIKVLHPQLELPWGAHE